MTVTLHAEPDFDECLAVTSNLRQRDRQELFATQWGSDPSALARDAVSTGAFRWSARLDGRPVALIGAFPRWPNVWTAWAYGTDEWPAVVGVLTRHVRRFMLPALYRSGAHRVDAYAMLAHTDARKWLTFLGAEPKQTLDNWGRNGETFVCYVWTREKTARLINEVEQRKANTRK